MKRIHFFPQSAVLLVCIIFAVLPFFWFTPGELELGGDSNRLYLYDPGSFWRAENLYSVEPEGLGMVRPDQTLLPFVLTLEAILSVVRSPFILMNLLNAIKLAGSFYFVYRIVVEILTYKEQKRNSASIHTAAIVAGIFYTLAPSVGANMRAALLTHNQVFINPMVFYLVLRFLVTRRALYLWVLLLATVIFSPNFSLIAPPPLFAFYPLALTFLGIYVRYVLGKPLPWKKIIPGAVVFVGLHAFHILPVLSYVFDPASYFNSRIVDASVGQNEALNYFNAVRGLGKVSRNIFYSYADPAVRWATLGVPLVVVLGFLRIKKIPRDLLLISVFFFTTLFLISANITDAGLAFYRVLFYVPGFGMFRVFYGQWQWVFTFFYAVLLGYLLHTVLTGLHRKYAVITPLVLTGLIIYTSRTFVSGGIFTGIHQGSNNMTSVIRIHPDYEKTVAFLRGLPADGKVINFPFTDYVYQVVPGLNNGAYIGVSPVAYLTGRRDFSGYPAIAPFSETFHKLLRDKDYAAVRRLFGLLNIRYVLYNTDPKAYTEYFPAFPYSLIGQIIPDSRALAELVDNLTDKKIFEAGMYSVYEAGDGYIPHIHSVQTLIPYESSASASLADAPFDLSKGAEASLAAYALRSDCRASGIGGCAGESVLLASGPPLITYKRINPTKYLVDISRATDPFVLVFSDAFHKDWQLSIADDTGVSLPVRETLAGGSIGESYHEQTFWDTFPRMSAEAEVIDSARHFMINGYANAWYIEPGDSGNKNRYRLILEMTQQRLFYTGLAVSLASAGIVFLYGAYIAVGRMRRHG